MIIKRYIVQFIKKKKEETINVIHKVCIHPNCKIQPSFNIEGEITGLYCSEHKLNEMIDVINKVCIHPNCKTQPYYNIEGETKGLYCSKHKKDNMINVRQQTCIHPNCKKQPTYNIESETKRLYCSKHKKDNMIDITHKKCIYLGCKIRPNYNFEGEKKGLYCNSHKKENMVDVTSKICKTPLCSTQVMKKYDGYCLFCYINMFPDKPVSRNYKTKEYSVVEYVKTKYPELSWVSDKKIQEGCSKRRPDLLLDLGYQILIIEIDENQHINYDCSCDNKRIMELSQDLGHRPIIFIRFNPDGYINKEKNIDSCWAINKQGICAIKNTKKSEWDERLNTLSSQIDYWTKEDNKTNKILEIIQLFYDN